MDPNATLEALRACLARAREAKDGESWACEASDALAYIEDLDEWLSRGGFVPDAWNNCPCNGEIPK